MPEMHWWLWLLVSVLGAYVMCFVLLLVATAIGVKYYSWRERVKHSATTEMGK